MIADIKSYLNQIEKSVSIKFSLFTEDGKFIYGNAEDKKDLPFDFNGVISDEKRARTLFRFNFNNVSYVGVIKGFGEVQNNYAFLLKEMFEGYSSRTAILSKDEFCKALVLGELDVLRTKKYLKRYGIEDKNACAVLISSSGKSKEALVVADNYSEQDVAFTVYLDENQFVLAKYVSADVGEYSSATEFTEFLVQSIYEETGVKVEAFIGGSVGSVSSLSKSFSQAVETKRMSSSMNYQGGVHTYKEFMLYHVLEELPDYKLNEFYKLLTDYSDSQIFGDAEMTYTAEEFLENSLNVSETSRKLFLHRNTLNYRLDKIERETGLDIRKFSDAVIFRLIILLRNLIG